MISGTSLGQNDLLVCMNFKTSKLYAKLRGFCLMHNNMVHKHILPSETLIIPLALMQSVRETNCTKNRFCCYSHRRQPILQKSGVVFLLLRTLKFTCLSLYAEKLCKQNLRWELIPSLIQLRDDLVLRFILTPTGKLKSNLKQ